MKRFTETEKWRDPWFQKLDIQTRTLWLWVCDRVDNSGVVDICWPICNAETCGTFTEESMELLGDRVERLENGKWWIPRFVEFQFGQLSSHSKVHQSIEKLLSKHSLSHRVTHRVYDTLKEKDKDKDKEKDKEKEKDCMPVGAQKALMAEMGGSQKQKKPIFSNPFRDRFKTSWCSKYRECLKDDYVWSARDDKSVDSLMGVNGGDVDSFIEVAVKAWSEKDNKSKFWCSKSVTAQGFVDRYQEIKQEVGIIKIAKEIRPSLSDWNNKEFK